MSRRRGVHVVASLHMASLHMASLHMASLHSPCRRLSSLGIHGAAGRDRAEIERADRAARLGAMPWEMRGRGGGEEEGRRRRRRRGGGEEHGAVLLLSRTRSCTCTCSSSAQAERTAQCPRPSCIAASLCACAMLSSWLPCHAFGATGRDALTRGTAHTQNTQVYSSAEHA